MTQNRIDDTVIQVQRTTTNPFEEGYSTGTVPAIPEVQHLVPSYNPFAEKPKPREFYQMNLDIMRQRFDVERGLFGRTATFFATLSWWETGLIGLFIGGVFAAVGAAISLAWVIALPIAALALYAGAVFLFENDMQSEANRLTHLSAEMVLQQEFMQDYHQALESVEGQHRQSIEQLNRTNQQLTASVAHYHQKAQSLGQAIQGQTQTIGDIQSLGEGMRTRTETMQHTQSQFAQEMSELPEFFTQQLSRMDSIANQALAATQSLHDTAVSLKIEVAAISVQANPPANQMALKQLLEDYPFTTEDEQLRFDRLHQQREESIRAAKAADAILVQQIQALENSLAHHPAANTDMAAIPQEPDIVTEDLEQNQKSFNLR